MPRVLVVSHASMLAVNQLPHAALLGLGWDTFLVVPARWSHAYSSRPIRHETVPSLRGRISARRVVYSGSGQRYFYLTSPSRILKTLRPDLVFIEEEPTSLAGGQWAWACHRAGVPFGLQVAENLDRPYPLVARLVRAWTTLRADFLAARSPTAARLAGRHGFVGPAPVVPHGVPGWELGPTPAARPFTVGYAGRLVPEKGLDDLVAAVQPMVGTHLRLMGDGPMAAALRATRIPDGRVDVVTGISHEAMAGAYGAIDVLVLPSRTTKTWVEQFGRVLVEAMWCGVPVVGSDSGEIPWVIDVTGGGIVFPEGDVPALRGALETLRDDPALRQRLAVAGRAKVAEQFSVEASGQALHRAMTKALRGTAT
jgi:glycosyltransferase involved in cell wall biosynthesis